MAGKITEGHRRFRDWKRSLRKSNKEIADMLGIGASQVSRWDTTSARPDVAQIAILARIANIPADLWLTKAESKQLEKLAPEQEVDAKRASTFPADGSVANGGTGHAA